MITAIVIGLIVWIVISIITFVLFIVYTYLPTYLKYTYDNTKKLTFLQQCIAATKDQHDRMFTAISIAVGVFAMVTITGIMCGMQQNTYMNQRRQLIAEHYDKKCTSCRYFISYNEYICKWDENGNMIKEKPKYIFQHCPEIEKEVGKICK